MIAVIFEVRPTVERGHEYFDLAAELRPMLEQIDGFISIERFESLSTFWRDEEAIRTWRNLEQHRSAQAQGRSHVFSDYRIRVAAVLRDYGMRERADAPRDSRAAHD